MRRVVLASVVLASGLASAQPADPYAPAAPADPYGPDPSPAPSGPSAPTPSGPSAPMAPTTPELDAVLAEQVAQSLVARAQELFDARVYVDAKQLALEALATSSAGAAGEQARHLVREANKQLGLPDQPLPGDPIQVKVTAVDDKPPPVEDKPIVEPERPRGPTQIASRVHGALYLGLVGTTIGAFFSEDNPASGAVPVGLAGGVGGALLAPLVERKLGWSEAQVRTFGSGTVWGGVIGGLFGDAVQKTGTTSRDVLVGASIGSTIGGLAGAGVASQQRFTRGDVALVDTLAGIGAVGGLTLGMLMQPAETEAYSVNAIVGAAGGYLAGYIAGPLTNTTPRRMLRVVGTSAIGGAVPFLLYAAMYDESSTADERTVGFLSTAGLLVGAYVGFRLTRHLDEDLDTPDGTRKRDPDAVGLVHRHAGGAWTLGQLGVQPLSPLLAPQPGASVPLLGGSW